MAGDARPEAAVTVAVLDDHPVVLEGVQSWIERDPDRRVRLLLAARTCAEFAGPALDAADVLVIDLNLDGRSMLDTIGELSAAGRRIVVFSQEVAAETVLAALDAGASTYLTKQEGREHFVGTVVAVAADRPYVTPAVAGALWADSRATRPALSDRERTALLHWFQGMSKASVATRMKLSVHTVDQYIARARIKYAKIGRPGPTKAALLARAIEDGLLRAEDVGEYRSRATGMTPERPS